MIILPQTIANDSTEALNALLRESTRFREWNAAEVQTLVRAIEKLQKVDARRAFILFGALAAICGDVDGVFEYYKKALLLPDAPETKHEYWVSLRNVGLYSEAQEIGSWLLDPKRGFFGKVWRRAMTTGQVLEVWNRLADATKTYPDLSQIDFSTVENAASVMMSRRLSDQHIVSVLDLMGEIQRTHRIMFSGEFVSFLRVIRPPDDPAYLYLTMPLECGVDEIHAMNRKLARLVVDRLPEGAFPQGIVASFAKAYPVELLAAA